MADETGNTRAQGGLLANFSAAAAVLGGFIAVGQSFSTWIEGQSQSRIANEKATQELKLAELKSNSDLAEGYLKLIIDKDTGSADRIMLLGALSDLQNHPLQAWAKKRLDGLQQSLDDLAKAQAAEFEATKKKTDVERKIAGLQAEIDALNAEKRLNSEDVNKTNSISAVIVSKSVELGQLNGTLGVLSAQVEETSVVVERKSQGYTTNTSTSMQDHLISDLASRVTSDLLEEVFPKLEKARENISANYGFLAAAMKEFQISEPRFASAVIATIAVETPDFSAYEETPAPYNTKTTPFDVYEGAARLGNTTPGDGAKFRGRGFIGLTGRYNYAKMSERLGLGTRLLDNPEDARSPEVASRIICAFFIDSQSRVVKALDQQDFGEIRRLVSGSASDHLAQFLSAYNKTLSLLTKS